MAQIPHLPERSRMRGVPDGPGPVHVTADAFGARQAQAFGQLGRAIGQAGEDHMHWARRNAESLAKAEMASVYMKGIDEERIRILQSAGGSALEADREMEEAIRRRSDASRKSLKGNPLAQSVFDELRLDYDRQNVNAARSHKESERRKFDLASSQAYKQGLIGECAKPGGNNFAGNIEKIVAENAKIYAGQPPELKTWQDQADAFLAIKARAQAESLNNGPMGALGFLDSGVEQWVGDGMMKVQFDSLHRQYQVEAVESRKRAVIDSDNALIDAAFRVNADPAEAAAAIRERINAIFGPGTANRFAYGTPALVPLAAAGGTMPESTGVHATAEVVGEKGGESSAELKGDTNAQSK